jgi:hypothetical protein
MDKAIRNCVDMNPRACDRFRNIHAIGCEHNQAMSNK